MRNSVKQDKFNYIGYTILELAKLEMYKLVYDVWIPNYGDNFEPVYTDTDSLMFKLTITLGSTPEKEREKTKHMIYDSELGKLKSDLVMMNTLKKVFSLVLNVTATLLIKH